VSAISGFLTIVTPEMMIGHRAVRIIEVTAVGSENSQNIIHQLTF
jgi:hypothetical protein